MLDARGLWPLIVLGQVLIICLYLRYASVGGLTIGIGENTILSYRRRRPSSVARYRYYKRRDLNRDTAKRWLRQKEHSSRCFIMFSRTHHTRNEPRERAWSRVATATLQQREIVYGTLAIFHTWMMHSYKIPCLKQCFSQIIIQNRWRKLLEGFY